MLVQKPIAMSSGIDRAVYVAAAICHPQLLPQHQPAQDVSRLCFFTVTGHIGASTPHSIALHVRHGPGSSHVDSLSAHALLCQHTDTHMLFSFALPAGRQQHNPSRTVSALNASSLSLPRVIEASKIHCSRKAASGHVGAAVYCLVHAEQL